MSAVVLATLIACAGPRPAGAQSSVPAVPGASLAEIPLGSPIADVIARLGTPAAVRLTTPGDILAYVFNQYAITAYVHANVVVALSTTNSVLAAVAGIGLGAPAASVVAAFGTSYVNGVVAGLPALLYPAAGVGFGFDRSAVAAVMVFAPASGPGGAKPAPGRDTPQPPVTSQSSPGATAAGPAPAPAPAPTQAPAPATGQGSTPPAEGAPAQAPAPAPPAPVSGVPWTAAPTVSPGPAGITDRGDSMLDVTTIPGTMSLAEVPGVGHLRPFSAESDYLSLPGYLRYLIYGMTHVWVSAQESERFVEQDVNPPQPSQP